MRSPSFLRSPLRAAVVLAAVVSFGAVACIFGPEQTILWTCLNPETGKLDHTIHDDNHFVNGKADPCHCYDPCGPQKTCPIVVDAGEPDPACDAGMGDGG